jgi:hypothetical protein
MTEPSATDAYPSLDVVLPLAREQLAAQFETQEVLTTRAAQLLGFTGVVLGLVANSSYLQQHWHAASTAGVVLLVMAAVFSLAGLFVRSYKRAGDAAQMESILLKKPAPYARRVVLRATAKAVERNKRPLVRLTWCIKLGSLALVAGVLLIAIGR